MPGRQVLFEFSAAEEASMLHAELCAGVGPASNDGHVRRLGTVLKMRQTSSFRTSVSDTSGQNPRVISVAFKEPAKELALPLFVQALIATAPAIRAGHAETRFISERNRGSQSITAKRAALLKAATVGGNVRTA